MKKCISSPSKIFVTKKTLFQEPVTFRKINIFLWEFFKTISTRSENTISGVFQTCSATSKKLWTIKVVKQKRKYHFFHEIKKANLQFRFWISGKPQKWSFQIEDNIYIQFPIEKITFQLKNKNFEFLFSTFDQNLKFSFLHIPLWWSTTFFLVADHAWKTPEMEFSDRVDMV